jgi:type VI secretion system protein ImpE
MSDPRTDAEAVLRAGDPAMALKHLTAAVKAKPADAKLRIFMAQLLCVLGQWERAHTQLNVVADIDSETIAMRETMGHAIRCELMRAKVFAGERTPMVFGQPDQWLALLIESLLQRAKGDVALSKNSPVERSTPRPRCRESSTVRHSAGSPTPTPVSGR